MRRSATANALLLIDFINPLLGRSGGQLARAALRAAHATAALKRRARRARIPVIYANDHFGRWKSDLPSLIEECRRRRGCAGAVLEALAPGRADLSVLKPRHSAFYGTPLEFLLDELRVKRLILTGIETDACVMATAYDAYMRKLQLWVPRNCTAARSTRKRTTALEFMKVNLKADTRAA